MGDWEAASSHTSSSIVPVLQSNTLSWKPGLVVLLFQPVTALLQKMGFFSFYPSKAFTVLEEYF